MSGLFGSQPTQQAAPTPKPPAPMPDSTSPGVLEARRKAQMDIMGRAGRSSTILTAPKDRGGSDYTSTTLGAGNS
jgi:aspartokinase